MRQKASIYAEEFHASGGALAKYVGFIDGSEIRIARSGGNVHQRAVYSGHKRMHCLSYQTITTPDGLIFHIYVPIEGTQQGAYLYRSCGLDTVLRDALKVNGIQYCILETKIVSCDHGCRQQYPQISASEVQVQYNCL